MDYVSFMRKVDGRPKPTRNTKQFYTGSMTVDTESVENLLAGGDTALLDYAFLWRSTPQGHEYWYDIRSGTCEVCPEGKEFLKFLLREYS